MADRRLSIINDDKKYVWHPFTQMADWVKDDPAPPLAIARGSGNYLYDTAGRKYFDGVSSLWVTVHGHRKKEIDAAIRRQLGKVAHTTFLGLTHEPAVQLAKELVSVAPRCLTRVFYSDNGSTAVEVALKMALQYWQCREPGSRRRTFLSLRNAYHGDTIGSVSVGGMGLFHARFRPLLFKPYFAPSPYCYRCVHNKSRRPQAAGCTRKTFAQHRTEMQCSGQCLKKTENILRQHHRNIAAMIVEPLVQGAAGMLTMPPGYLKALEQLCRQYHTLLICDEVATGFGRTGTFFAVEQEDVRPDFLCMAKGLTGGYLPLAATLATETVYAAFLGAFAEMKSFFHGHTYTANPLACAAALANLAVFRKEHTLRSLPAKIACLAEALRPLATLPVVGEIRQRGLMCGIELVQDQRTRKDFPAHLKVGARICAAARHHGLLIRPLGNVLVLMPPLSSTAPELRRAVKTLHTLLTTPAVFCQRKN